MKIQGNRTINPDGKVELSLNAAIYALSCGGDMKYIHLQEVDSDEVEKFNKNCKKFGLEEKIITQEIDHERNHENWMYDCSYDKINLEEFFLELCQTDEQRSRVMYELGLYTEYNMTKLLRCMIWLVHYMEDNNIFWGIGRGSSVASYCLYLIGLHMIDSLKYDLDVKEFLKY